MDCTEIPKVIEAVAKLEINNENTSKFNNKIENVTQKTIHNTQELNSYFETRKPLKKNYENLQWLTGC